MASRNNRARPRYNGTNLPLASEVLPVAHGGSRDGHPLATTTLDGLMAGADKASLVGLDSRLAVAPFTNVLADSGRYAGKINTQAQALTAAWVNSGFFAPYNGTTVANLGKFIHNNTTNGGTAGVLTQQVIELLAAMGRSGAAARYGVEFYTTLYTMGAGTTPARTQSDGITRYTLTLNGNRAVFGFGGGLVTLAAWMHAYGTTQAIVGGAGLPGTGYWKSGVKVPGDDLLLSPAEGWVHVRVIGGSSIGYNAEWPLIQSRSGDQFGLALPAIFTGGVDPGIHTSPLPTQNTLIDN